MQEVTLIRPNIDYKQEIINYRKAFLAIDDSLDGTSKLKNFEDINDWLKYIKFQENKKTCDSDWVPTIQYLLIRKNDNKLVGMGDLRLKLNDVCFKYYGNIGYSILPSERNKGYGNQLLKLLLLKAKDYRLKEVWVNCYKNNEASKRIILNNGGILISEVLEPCDDVLTSRYLIKL